MDQNCFENLYLTLQSTMAELRMINHFKTILFNMCKNKIYKTILFNS